MNPANKRRLDIIVVGTGLLPVLPLPLLSVKWVSEYLISASKTLRVVRTLYCCAQGGINAAKKYQNDGDSVYRLFYDTVKGGDYRAREANVYRLAEVSNAIIDQCVAQRCSLSLANTVACSTTVLSVAHRFHVHSTLKVRQANNCCWVHTRTEPPGKRRYCKNCLTL